MRSNELVFRYSKKSEKFGEKVKLSEIFIFQVIVCLSSLLKWYEMALVSRGVNGSQARHG